MLRKKLFLLVFADVQVYQVLHIVKVEALSTVIKEVGDHDHPLGHINIWVSL